MKPLILVLPEPDPRRINNLLQAWKRGEVSEEEIWKTENPFLYERIDISSGSFSIDLPPPSPAMFNIQVTLRGTFK